MFSFLLAQTVTLNLPNDARWQGWSAVTRAGNRFEAEFINGEDQGSLTVTPNGNGFDIRMDTPVTAQSFVWLLELDADIPITATYNFGGSRSFFSPTGITDDESLAGDFPIGYDRLYPAKLRAIEPGVFAGRIEVNTLGQPATFTVFDEF